MYRGDNLVFRAAVDKLLAVAVIEAAASTHLHRERPWSQRKLKIPGMLTCLGRHGDRTYITPWLLGSESCASGTCSERFRVQQQSPWLLRTAAARQRASRL